MIPLVETPLDQMTQPRRSQLDMNFDGLTDSVTNLVGALILLIVLLIGVTQQAVMAPPPDATPQSTGVEQSDDADTTLAQLLRQATRLRAQAQQSRLHCRQIDQEVDELTTQAAPLLGVTGNE